MISKQEAWQLARQNLDMLESPNGPKLVILDHETMELAYGWVFFWNSQRFLETGEIRFSLAGNGPILVERSNGAVHEFGSAWPVEKYLKEFEASRGLT